MNSPARGRKSPCSGPRPRPRRRRPRRCRVPQRLAGLKPMMRTRPSGTSTRSTSRKVRCGSRASSSACGRTTRSRLAASKGKAWKSQRSDGAMAARSGSTGSSDDASTASQRCGMRVARRASSSGKPSCRAWKPNTSTSAWSRWRCSHSSRYAPTGVSSHWGKFMIAPSLMNLTAVPAFSDNYIWMLDDGRSAIVVDPGEAGPVEAALDARRLTLAAILVTHHHADHVGGVDRLRSRLQGPVFGPAHEDVPQPCDGHVEGDVVQALGLRFEVIDVPGHTAGHIAFFNSEGAGEPRVCCGHEYTVSNLRFAHAVEPNNDDIARHIERCQVLRAAGKPTVPSPIGRERRINPFLRCAEPVVIKAAVAHGASGRGGGAVLGAIRTWKNEF